MLKWSVAPVECGRFVVQRSLWGHLGSVIDVRNRLDRMRRRLDHYRSTNSLSCPAYFSMNSLWMRSRALRAMGCSKHLRMRCRRLPTIRPDPEGVREPSRIPKMCFIWARQYPLPSNTVITRGATVGQVHARADQTKGRY